MRSGITVIFTAILVFLAAGGIGWLVSMFNSLIQVKNNIAKAWKNIDVLLLQRNEELTKLVELCREYLHYEKDVLASLTTLRLAYGNAKSVVAKTNIENQVLGRLAELRGAGERYPDLKTNALYQKLQERISDLESQIADRRVFFNDTVAIYNTRIKRVPEALFAAVLRFKPHPYLNLTAAGS